MPLNVNDSDLDPGMANFPESRIGCTEMTFGLIRFEITATLRRLQYIPPGPRKCNKFFAEMSLEKKESWIKECHQRLEDRYLKDCDMSVPLYWVIATVSRLIMSKMWLMVYHPFQRMNGGSSLPQEIRDKLFQTSLENIEYSLLLESEERTRKWGWLFRTYVQWHAIAFLLTELCLRTEGEQVDRAWKAIDFIVNRRRADDQVISHKMKGHLWRPLRRLIDRARAERDNALAKKKEEQQAQTEAQVQTSASTFDPVVPIMDLDLGVDRLFPAAALTNDPSTNWTDPRIESNPFKIPAAFGTSSNVPTSIDETIAPITVTGQYPTQFEIGTNWVLDAGRVSPTSPLPSSSLDASPTLAEGTIDWANIPWEYGMDIDQNAFGDSSQSDHFSSNFGGISQWY